MVEPIEICELADNTMLVLADGEDRRCFCILSQDVRLLQAGLLRSSPSHNNYSHLRAHAFARSVTVARSSAVQASSSRRQRGGGPSYVAPRSRNPPIERRRDSPIFSSLFPHGPPLRAVG